jgi:carboxyl-terminal processing protease
MLEKGYLYLRITNFNENTTDELRKALKGRRDELKGVVLDLRNNPGGLLKQAVSVADIFLRDGKIVYTKGKVDQAQMNFSADREPSDLMVPLTVLINSGTASASEIVAGALQDQKRALIVGERSFGKGSVQTVIPLVDGSGIKLTTALYYTPDGRSIQAAGIEPDIKVPFIEAEGDTEKRPMQMIFRERDLEGHLENNGTDGEGGPGDSGNEVRQMLQEDNQLNIALQLVKSLPEIQKLR